MAKKMNDSFNELFPDLVGSTPPAAKRARLSTGRQASSASKSRYRPLKFEFKAPPDRGRGPLETILPPELNVHCTTVAGKDLFKQPPPKGVRPAAEPLEDADDWGDDNDDALLVAATQMMDETKVETAATVGISDEELMKLTLALNDDDFNFEEDFPGTDVNPSKARLNQSMAVFAPLEDERFFERIPEPDQLVAQLRSETKALRDQTEKLANDYQQTKGEVLFLRDKLEAKSRELEKERSDKRHLASDLNRQLEKLTRQKEADVQAVRSEMQFMQLELSKAQEKRRLAAAAASQLNTTVAPHTSAAGAASQLNAARPPHVSAATQTNHIKQEIGSSSKEARDRSRLASSRVKLSTTIPNLLIEAFCAVTRTDKSQQASLLIRTRRGEDASSEWIQLLDTAAANISRGILPLRQGHAGQPAALGDQPFFAAQELSAERLGTEDLRQVEMELKNIAELIEMSGEAFKSREMELILDTAQATIQMCKTKNDWRLLEAVLRMVGTLCLYELPDLAVLNLLLQPLQELLRSVVGGNEIPVAPGGRGSLCRLVLVLARATSTILPILCSAHGSSAPSHLTDSSTGSCFVRDLLDEFYTVNIRTKIVHDVKYMEPDYGPDEGAEVAQHHHHHLHQEENVATNQEMLLANTPIIIRFVEQSIVAGYPWTQGRCLGCSTSLVRSLVAAVYSLILIYMDRLAAVSENVVDAERRSLKQEEDTKGGLQVQGHLEDVRKIIGDCLITLVRLKTEVGGSRDWELWIRVLEGILSENKKRLVWSLSILPSILGSDQYAAQLRALDITV